MLFASVWNKWTKRHQLNFVACICIIAVGLYSWMGLDPDEYSNLLEISHLKISKKKSVNLFIWLLAVNDYDKTAAKNHRNRLGQRNLFFDTNNNWFNVSLTDLNSPFNCSEDQGISFIYVSTLTNYWEKNPIIRHQIIYESVYLSSLNRNYLVRKKLHFYPKIGIDSEIVQCSRRQFGFFTLLTKFYSLRQRWKVQKMAKVYCIRLNWTNQ